MFSMFAAVEKSLGVSSVDVVGVGINTESNEDSQDYSTKRSSNSSSSSDSSDSEDEDDKDLELIIISSGNTRTDDDQFW